MNVNRSLVLEVNRYEVPVGEPVVVRVTSSNRPVEGAIVEAGSKRVRTDAGGWCEVTFHSPGFWKIIAAKSPTDTTAYKPVSTLVRTLPRTSTRRKARPTDPLRL
ncbi:hypothetical protein [Natronorubrum daqingense]|uniref:Carboxypeptidase regulatory-like domain-containing protein n=1 Tax=Natronorubrum daqingense TaxID=588898 RepID=A0A1N6X5V8_9EURY|nr:hypothetical protein [Natronorubrum daqingense]APX96038.1 hypothetical protein BB347_05055 [Natronorubrum daqingense]SIQ97713.1 hypothetical protein SAMN05421809_0020 [Natronorubrum daqingense]